MCKNKHRNGGNMSKIIVAYWSQTGNTEAMANAVGDPYTVYMDKEEFNKFTEQDAYLIFVTNEIGLGGVSPDAVQRRFTDLQGWLNQYIASRADEVILMVSGIPLKVK